ncbi:MAG TPA: D-glycero-beta-D-manno-heptose 1-phosphate adenylyltransferase, partial [Solirubrobacteraceae bacterium]|nr:D-glycero-beta-D-manno-heptose 1-phosphate adenylyltransferase [Solirubrobacteraceae bacterium]
AVVAASAFVAAGGAGAARLGPQGGPFCDSPARVEGPTSPTRAELNAEAHALAAQTRAQGGVLVATGGCFDLLHPGHVHTLQAARGLGDRLVVCLNGDASVRRLKGPARPLVGEEDRAAVLRALGCVDAVLVFDEDTPSAALEHLRPHVWAKGGDYTAHELPEAATLAGWGGQAVILPFVDGRSTTRLIEEASAGGVA